MVNKASTVIISLQSTTTFNNQRQLFVFVVDVGWWREAYSALWAPLSCLRPFLPFQQLSSFLSWFHLSTQKEELLNGLAAAMQLPWCSARCFLFALLFHSATQELLHSPTAAKSNSAPFHSSSAERRKLLFYWIVGVDWLLLAFSCWRSWLWAAAIPRNKQSTLWIN